MARGITIHDGARIAIIGGGLVSQHLRHGRGFPCADSFILNMIKVLINETKQTLGL